MTTRLSLYIGLLPALCFAADVPGAEDRPTFRVVAQLSQYGAPSTCITEGEPGLFYLSGQPSSSGVAFTVTARGAQTLLGTFPSNNLLSSCLISAADGRFYSTVAHPSGPAEVVRVGRAPGGEVKVFPPQGLVPSFAGNLPGGRLFALSGGTGPIWYLDLVGLDENVTTVYQFPTGETPSLSALYGGDGDYYGMSIQPSGSGYLYRVTPSGSLAKLYTAEGNVFGSSYGTPVIEASDGSLYSTTSKGGANGTGTIYRVTKEGKYDLLYTFPKSTISLIPTALIEASDGNIYGTTLGSRSLLFRVTKSGQYTTMKAMDLETRTRLTRDAENLIRI